MCRKLAFHSPASNAVNFEQDDFESLQQLRKLKTITCMVSGFGKLHCESCILYFATPSNISAMGKVVHRGWHAYCMALDIRPC